MGELLCVPKALWGMTGVCGHYQVTQAQTPEVSLMKPGLPPNMIHQQLLSALPPECTLTQPLPPHRCTGTRARSVPLTSAQVGVHRRSQIIS